MRMEDAKYELDNIEVRWGRAGEEAPNYCDWRSAPLIYNDFSFTLAKENWAEYTYDSYSEPYDEYVVEDYYLQIRRKGDAETDTDTVFQSLVKASKEVQDVYEDDRLVYATAFSVAFVKHGDALVSHQIAKDAVEAYQSLEEDD